MYRFKKILVFISRCYSPDMRALALMRIGIAMVVIADLLIRGADLGAHYTDQGIWPNSLVQHFGWKPGYWSLHTLSGSWWWEFFIFFIHFVFAVFLLAGYKTKLSTLLVWLLTISLHNRNLYVLQSGDDLLRLILFWGLFLPWNARYSMDARQSVIKTKQNLPANLGYFLLLASVYFFSAALKTSQEWHSEGSAVYYALSLEQIRLPLIGNFLYQFPGLMKILTWIVYYTELLIPILILYPTRSGNPRFLAFVLIGLLHAGIGLTLYVGLFFVINIVAALGLLPKFVPDKIENKFSSIFKWTKKEIKFNHVRSAPPVKWFTTGFCLFAIVICLIINLSSVKWFDYTLRKEINYPVNALRLDQYWGMFSPGVLKKDGWFVYHGIDSIGRQWDLRLNEDYVDYTKPKHIVSMYKSDRWRKLAENMQNDYFTFLRPRYGNYILREWNKTHPEKKILTLNLYFMEKESLPFYKTGPVKKTLYCVCNGS